MANELRSNVTKPMQMLQDDSRLAAILELIQVSFSYMDGRINPPSSMQKLTLADIALQCETGEVWAIGNPIKACMFLTDMGDSLLLGKLAVAIDARGNGLARELVKVAEERVKFSGKKELELLTRIELVENHLAFSKLGFVKVGEGTHAGFDRPTYIRMTKQVAVGSGL